MDTPNTVTPTRLTRPPIGLGTQDQRHSTSHSQQGAHTVGHGVENFFPLHSAGEYRRDRPTIRSSWFLLL